MTRAECLCRIAEVLRDGRGFLATTHVRPDGDAVASLLALTLGLRLLGKEVRAVTQDPVPPVYAFLPSVAEIVTDLPSPAEAAALDAGIALDCDGLDRTGTVGPLLEATGHVIDLDHHAGTKAFGDLTCVRPEAACTGELVYELLGILGVEPTPEIATCLFASHAYDTGRFTHSNTSARVFANCSRLVELGARPEPVIRALFETRSLSRTRLRGAALTRATVDANTAVAWAYVTPEDFLTTGAIGADTDGIVDELRAVEGVAAAVLVSEREAGTCRVSIRVRDSELNAARVCAGFGGGGHVRAAGCTIESTALDAARRVLEAIGRQMDEGEPC